MNAVNDLSTLKGAKQHAAHLSVVTGYQTKLYQKGSEFFAICDGEITQGPAPGSKHIATFNSGNETFTHTEGTEAESM